MNKTLLALTLTSLFTLPAMAADNYTVDARHTFPAFEISHMGFSMQRGRFNQTSGSIVLDTENQYGSINISIGAASVDTGLAELETHLKSKDFFDAEKYPAITFTEGKLKFDGDKPVSAEGTFTLLGVSKPVTLNIEHFKCGMHMMTKKLTCGANASTSIRRSEFGMTKYVPFVGDEVKITIQIEATKD
jgi:polyisoprenoid-binding protein YceI